MERAADGDERGICAGVIWKNYYLGMPGCISWKRRVLCKEEAGTRRCSKRRYEQLRGCKQKLEEYREKLSICGKERNSYKYYNKAVKREARSLSTPKGDSLGVRGLLCFCLFALPFSLFNQGLRKNFCCFFTAPFYPKKPAQIRRRVRRAGGAFLGFLFACKFCAILQSLATVLRLTFQLNFRIIKTTPRQI